MEEEQRVILHVLPLIPNRLKIHETTIYVILYSHHAEEGHIEKLDLMRTF